MRKIKKGDNVVVIAGRDKGKRGDVAAHRRRHARHRQRRQPGEEAHAAQPDEEPAGRHRHEGNADPRFERRDLEPGHAEGRTGSASARSKTAARSASSSPTASRSMADDKKDKKGDKKGAKPTRHRRRQAGEAAEGGKAVEGCGAADRLTTPTSRTSRPPEGNLPQGNRARADEAVRLQVADGSAADLQGRAQHGRGRSDRRTRRSSTTPSPT